MNETEPYEDSLFPEVNIKFATFWNRLGAAFIDGIIILIFTFPVTYFNIVSWKIPFLFILTSGIAVIYKPYLEYRYGATLGKMAVGIQVLGHQFEKVSLNEEMRRVSFYLIPAILTQIMTMGFYFSANFNLISNYREYNRFIVSSNPAITWLNGIVFVLLFADCITFFLNDQNRALHDIYAGTYVIEKPKTNSH